MTDSRLAINYDRLRRGVVQWIRKASDLEEERIVWDGYDTHRPPKRPYVGVKVVGPSVRVPPVEGRPKIQPTKLRFHVDPTLDPGKRALLALNNVHMSALVPIEGPEAATAALLELMRTSLDRWTAVAVDGDPLAIDVNERAPGGIWQYAAKQGITATVIEEMLFQTVTTFPIFRCKIKAYAKEPGDDVELLEVLAMSLVKQAAINVLEFHGVRFTKWIRSNTDESRVSGAGTEQRNTLELQLGVTSRKSEVVAPYGEGGALVGYLLDPSPDVED